ncbi:MAG: hypothetical protein AVDCRST_MAG79-853, partial [uncultured Thermoleophilia bacterium]
FVDVGGPGRHQDLLLTSVWPGWPLLRHVLRATRRPAEALHSSILPLRVDGEARLVTARIEAAGEVAAGLAGLHAAVATGGVRITVAAAPLARADDRPLLELALGRRLSPAEGEALRFDPANAGAGLPPIGLLGLRDAAYAGSSRGRAEAAER